MGCLFKGGCLIFFVVLIVIAIVVLAFLFARGYIHFPGSA
jgi:hypothetical protein